MKQMSGRGKFFLGGSKLRKFGIEDPRFYFYEGGPRGPPPPGDFGPGYPGGGGGPPPFGPPHPDFYLGPPPHGQPPPHLGGPGFMGMSGERAINSKSVTM